MTIITKFFAKHKIKVIFKSGVTQTFWCKNCKVRYKGEEITYLGFDGYVYPLFLHIDITQIAAVIQEK